MLEAIQHRQHASDASRYLTWLLFSMPLVGFLLLRTGVLADPLIAVPAFHSFVVTLTAALGLVVGILITLIMRDSSEPGSVFINMAFFFIAGFFFVHGALTPGVWYSRFSSGIVWAPLLGLMAGAVTSAASVLATERWTWVLRYRRALLGSSAAVVVVFGIVTGVFPTLIPPPRGMASGHHGDSDLGPYAAFLEALGQAPPSPAAAGPLGVGAILLWIGAAATVALFVVAARRYFETYRFSRVPLHGAVTFGLVLFAQATVILMASETWRASWWLYHVLVFWAFVAIAAGILGGLLGGAPAEGLVASLFFRDAVQHLEQSYTEVIAGLVAAIEARDRYTQGHSSRVAQIAVRIGQELRFPPEHLRLLHQAALLHDVGKIGVPDSILNKPGPLTLEERRLIEEHPRVGEQILERIHSLHPILDAVRSHHERLDGSGYPDRRAGRGIPLEASIIAVADVYEAMTSDRAYRAAWPYRQVIEYIQDHAGDLFEPEVVEALAHVLDADPKLQGRTAEGVPAGRS